MLWIGKNFTREPLVRLRQYETIEAARWPQYPYPYNRFVQAIIVAAHEVSQFLAHER